MTLKYEPFIDSPYKTHQSLEKRWWKLKLFNIRRSQSLWSSLSEKPEGQSQHWQHAFSRALATAKGNISTQSWHWGFWNHSGWVRVAETFGDHLSSPLCSAGSPKVGCSGLLRFWVSPGTETPQPPRITSSDVQSQSRLSLGGSGQKQTPNVQSIF